jgi:hypothetical protein
MERRDLVHTILILIGVAALMWVMAWAMTSAEASPAPSPSPSVRPSTEPTQAPAPAAVVELGRTARRQALAAWERNVRIRWCCDLKPRTGPPRLPPRAADEPTWRRAITAQLRATDRYRNENTWRRAKMRRPGGHPSGERWKPLALWVGWTRSEWPTVRYIMAERGGTGESGGCPGAYNETSGCAGLMQLHPMFYTRRWPILGVKRAFDPFDPEENLRAAEGIQDDCGWGPWAL